MYFHFRSFSIWLLLSLKSQFLFAKGVYEVNITTLLILTTPVTPSETDTSAVTSQTGSRLRQFLGGFSMILLLGDDTSLIKANQGQYEETQTYLDNMAD